MKLKDVEKNNKSRKILVSDRIFGEFLEHPSGVVHSVFSKAVNIYFQGNIYTLLVGYLENPDWPEVCLGVPGSGYVSGSCFAPGEIIPGDEVKREGRVLHIGEKVSLSFGEMHVFSDDRFWIRKHGPMDWMKIEKSIQRFEQGLRDVQLETGASIFYQEYYMKCLHTPTVTQAFLNKKLKKMMDEIQKAKRNSSHWSLEEAYHVVGAGNGLTPAGDDFLCGLYMALQSSKTEEGEYLAKMLLKEMSVAVNTGRTTDVSRQMILFYGAHRAPSVYCRLAEAFLDGRPEMNAIIQVLLKIGHTSGMDLASGMAAGFQILLSI